MIPLYRYVVEGLRTTHQKKEGESSGGTSSPAPFWEGPAAPNAGMRHTLHCEEPKVTSFWGATDASGHMKAWPFWPNVRHSDRSFQLPGVQEENIFSSLPILGSLIGAQQIRLTEER